MNQKRLDDLIAVLLKFKTREEMLDFLQGILTPKELEELSTRLVIVKMLKKGITQEKIAKQLKVGVGTVTRGSNELKRGRFKNI